jgi:hypothetical protein
MKAMRTWAFFLILCPGMAIPASGQDTRRVNPAIAPPNVLLLARQEFQHGKTAAVLKLQAALAQAGNRLNLPNYWIHLRSLSGRSETLLFEPFDSFDQIEQGMDAWARVASAHPEIARIQEQIEAMLVNEDSVVAVRRDDLGYLANHIDMSEARFLKIVEVRLLPGHQNDFAEASRILAEAHARINSALPWVVYEVRMGQPSSEFLIFTPLLELKQNDDQLSAEADLQAAVGEESGKRLLQILREAYVSTASNLYAVSPEMSRMPKTEEPAEADPGASPASEPAPSETDRVDLSRNPSGNAPRPAPGQVPAVNSGRP